MELTSSHQQTRANHERAERRHEIVDAVRTVREWLMSTSGTRPAFDHEILRSFARTRMSASVALLALTTVTATILALWVDVSMAVAWGLLVLMAQGLMLSTCRSFLNGAPTDASLPRWRWKFIFFDGLYGLTWACALLLPTDDMLAVGIMLHAMLLVVLASATILAHLIPLAMVAVTLPVVVTSVADHVMRDRHELLYIMAAAAAVAGPLLVLVAHRLYRTSLSMLAFRAEKDAIFAELEQQKAISDDARRRAEEANLAKSRFLATMSHELRTPLNAILGFSEVMKDEVLGPINNPSYKEYSTDIHDSGRHLLELINEILDLSRIEAGRHKLNEHAVNLMRIAEDCHRLIKLRAKARDITIHEVFEDGLPKLWADERAIRQITLNLLSNAVKFTPQGGEVTLTVGWTVSGGQYLSVRDTGPGIPEDEIPIVLAAFGQGSIAQKNAEAGTGLGLPIVQALTSLHGGQFSLKSKLREGTEVTAAFPRARSMQSPGQISETRSGSFRSDRAAQGMATG